MKSEIKRLKQLRERRLSYEKIDTTGRTHREFTICSYNLLPESRVRESRAMYSFVEPRTLNWNYRKRNLLKEILSYKADVLLLQGLDHYTDWWQPQLGMNGYDSLYRAHPRKGGVGIFYRRDEFQLFKSEVIEFK